MGLMSLGASVTPSDSLHPLDSTSSTKKKLFLCDARWPFTILNNNLQYHLKSALQSFFRTESTKGKAFAYYFGAFSLDAVILSHIVPIQTMPLNSSSTHAASE